MIRRPPRSTLFPTRRSSDLGRQRLGRRQHVCSVVFGCASQTNARARAMPASKHRSEEHTSELQSHVNLVCRLLLEKKKKKKNTTTKISTNLIIPTLYKYSIK